jgi:hexokinase
MRFSTYGFVVTEDAMMVTFTVTALERIEGHGRLLALAALEIDFDGVTLRLQGVQVVRDGKGITTQAPHFRDPKNGVWVPAVILPDELRAAIAREVQSMVLRRSGRMLQEREVSLSKVFSTPLDQLIRDSITDT